MEKGNLRADVNVSVRRPGEPLGTRCEIKNVNSIRFIGQAIECEARRQIDIIEDGGKNRAGDAAVRPGQGRDAPHAHEGRGARLPLFSRSGPAAARTFADAVEELRQDLPELPDEKKARFMRDFGLRGYDAGVLVAERETAEFFEAA